MPSAASIRQTCTVIEAALSLAGAGIAGTLWQADRLRRDVPCSADGGCEIVAASAWSHIDLIVWHHVPVALLGLLGYVFLFVLAMTRLGTDRPAINYALHRLTWLTAAGGTGYSWYLQWVAHTKIGAFCVWCRSSAIVMTLLFLAAAWEWWAERRKSRQELQREDTQQEETQKGQELYG